MNRLFGCAVLAALSAGSVGCSSSTQRATDATPTAAPSAAATRVVSTPTAAPQATPRLVVTPTPRPVPTVKAQTVPAGTTVSEASAAQVIDLLARGEYEAVHQKFNAQMAASVSTEQVKQVWESGVQTWGPYQSHGPAVVGKASGGHPMYDFPLVMERGHQHLQIAYDSAGLIAGMYLRAGEPTGEFGK